MTTTEQSESELTAGLYYIVVAFGPPGVDGRRLTDDNGHITLSPPTVTPERKQEWLVTPVNGIRDIVIIQRPIIGHFPPNNLSYEGAPEPKKGEKIVLAHAPTEWRRELAPGFTSLLRVNGSHLGITLSFNPQPDPPVLVLNEKDNLQWVFQRAPPVE